MSDKQEQQENGVEKKPVAWMIIHPCCESGVVETTFSAAISRALDCPPGTRVMELYSEDQWMALLRQRAELVELLKELRDAVKAEPAMNNMKYDALGVKVNKAIAKAEGKE